MGSANLAGNFQGGETMTDVERKVLVDAVHGELGAAMVQMIQDDDQIICNHVREAHRMLSELLADAKGKEEDGNA